MSKKLTKKEIYAERTRNEVVLSLSETPVTKERDEEINTMLNNIYQDYLRGHRSQVPMTKFIDDARMYVNTITKVALRNYKNGEQRLIITETDRLRTIHIDGVIHNYLDKPSYEILTHYPSGKVTFSRIIESGHIDTQRVIRGKNQTLDESIPPYAFNYPNDFDPYVQYFAQPLNPPTIEEMLPLYNGHYYRLTPYLALFENAKTPAELTINAFGKKRYRKDLVKAVAEVIRDRTKNQHLHVAWLMRRADIPTDWLIEILKMETINVNISNSTHRFNSIRKYISKLDRTSYKRLIKEIVNNTINPSMFYDISGMSFPIDDKDLPTSARSWHDLEQQLLTIRGEYYRQKDAEKAERESKKRAQYERWLQTPAGIAYAERIEENRRLQQDIQRRYEEEQRERMEKLAKDNEKNYQTIIKALGTINYTVPIKGKMTEFELEIAKDASTLAHWSSVMNNCISSYTDRMMRKESVLFALTIKGHKTPAINAEISYLSGNVPELVQFLGKNNEVRPDIYPQFREQFEQAGIDTEFTYAERH